MGFQPSYQSETRIYGKYLRDNYSNGKIAVLSSNDDFGRDNIKGSDAVGNIVAEVTYETSAPTIDSELVKLKFSGANIFVNFASAKFAAQASHQEDSRDRLEARAYPARKLAIDQCRLKTRPPRKRQGHHHGKLQQGSCGRGLEG